MAEKTSGMTLREKFSRKKFEEKIRGNGSRKKTFEELTFEETNGTLTHEIEKY
jgi:hypothetical protein